jgi:tRNA threonylcarbamoyladenosine biosynthesis protein TsaB
MAWLLALDGATEQLALALVAPDGAVHAREEAGGAQASARLLPAVQALMAEAGVRGGELAAIGFGRGPGAFTGLRAICAAVQGLAWGWGKPVLAIDSLLLPVQSEALEATGAVAAVMDARMGEVYAARYRRGATGWACESAPALWSPAALRDAWQGDTSLTWTGNGLALLGLTPGDALPQRRAKALGELTWMAWQRGEGLDAAQAQPLYVRDKVALTTAEREARIPA